ncbi:MULTISPECIES: RnfH family protein [unclassified Colwellia]|jgi:putative ubiquitin-RnfH superfamily antitoxin RatB of RatAB toxin-antitoxin module|uniref:RnfH family protein n=1 Tax=unclassified Colwellia TaxID=196834 RepID=UPI0015F3A3BC|nr:MULTISPECIES: RnfH family protein [unclassified Colwellia]MBA6337667.1 RnfH family protein [Colwellia sp. BRX8-7]MBA6349927.1 RnfH family protein [Colwellia sp. BRX8-9]MBA6379676.1 RnfH family protein [Colwellia sp. BRX10-7]MBA6383838.1 RnfH family protein [Colwellia sp. BRX10-9]MBA6388509.1 RnfH family protein [Colwellia sp. BRX10-2]
MVDNIEIEQELAQRKIQIEVVYGLPDRQELLTLLVDEGTLLEQGIIASGILSVFEEIDLTVNNVGIWNRAAKLTDTLRDLDRIEIYRPLIADPKEVRKRRAEKAKDEGRADKVTGGRVDPRRNKAS